MTSMRTSLSDRVASPRNAADEARGRRLRRTALLRDAVAAISLPQVPDPELRERIRTEALRQIDSVPPPPPPEPAAVLAKRSAEALFTVKAARSPAGSGRK